MENNKSTLIGTMRIYTKKAADAAELFFAFENDFQKVGENEEAASSYIELADSSATQEEAEKYILKNFPFFEPFSASEEK